MMRWDMAKAAARLAQLAVVKKGEIKECAVKKGGEIKECASRRMDSLLEASEAALKKVEDKYAQGEAYYDSHRRYRMGYKAGTIAGGAISYMVNGYESLKKDMEMKSYRKEVYERFSLWAELNARRAYEISELKRELKEAEKKLSNEREERFKKIDEKLDKEVEKLDKEVEKLDEKLDNEVGKLGINANKLKLALLVQHNSRFSDLVVPIPGLSDLRREMRFDRMRMEARMMALNH